MKEKKEEMNKVKTKTQPKLPKLSAESVALGFVVTNCIHDGYEILLPILQSLSTLENVGNSFKPLEESIKKNLLAAIQLTCILPLAEKFLLEEKTARSAIASVYISIKAKIM